MNWYYAQAGQQIGPITEEELLRLAGSGTIQPDTLVWRDGLANWQPYAQAKPGGPIPPPVVPAVPGGAGGGNDVVCIECGKTVSREEAIAYGGNWVCATCKPVYFQKVKEGAALPMVPGELVFAGFWIRFCAKFVDWLLMGVVIGVPLVIFLMMSVGVPTPRRGSPAVPVIGLAVQLSVQFASTILIVLYNWFFLAKYSATLGKMACGLKVVSATGAPITKGQAFGRSAAEVLSQLICYIGYILAAFDSEKRALHDHMAGTRVVKK